MKTSLPSRAWLAVWLLCGVALLNYLDRIMLTTMRESVKASIPMTEAQFGLLTSVFLWVYGGLSPFAGLLADRWDRRRIILASLFIWSFTTWLTGYATTFEGLLATRVAMGISEACYLPAALALITDLHRGPTRSLAVGIHNCGISIGSGLAGLGGWLAQQYGWNTAFHFFGLAGMAYFFVLAIGLRSPPRVEAAAPPPKESFRVVARTLFGERSYRFLLGYWAVLGLAGWGVLGWMPTYFQQQFGMSQGSAGLAATGFLQISTVAGLLVGGRLADRMSLRTPRGRLQVAIMGLAIAAPAIFVTASTPLLWVAIIGLLIFGFGRAWADGNTMPILCQISDPRHRATGFGILNFFACAVGGLTIYAGGALRDANVNVRELFIFSGGGLLLCMLFLWLIRPSRDAA